MRLTSIPKVSIIVPVYKVENYIRRCLDSIKSQSFIDWECLLVDDGSPDNSGEICDEYASMDNRFKVFHIKNGGVSKARNYGLERVNGEYVMFVDSDDWIEQKCLESCAKEMHEHNLDLLQYGFERVSEDGKILETRQLGSNVCSFCEYVNNAKMLVCVAGSVYRRDLIEMYAIRFDEDMRLGEDQVFFYTYLCKAKRIKSIQNCYYKYFFNTRSATNNPSTQDCIKGLEGMRKIYNLSSYFVDPVSKMCSDFLQTILLNNDINSKEYKALFKKYSCKSNDTRILKVYRSLSWAPYIAFNVYGMLLKNKYRF